VIERCGKGRKKGCGFPSIPARLFIFLPPCVYGIERGGARRRAPNETEEIRNDDESRGVAKEEGRGETGR